MDRPEYIVCIRHTHEEKKRTSWCGRHLGPSVAFIGIDHAVYNTMAEGRLLACPECLAAVAAVLAKAAELVKGDLPSEVNP
jgi:hypothetical protein